MSTSTRVRKKQMLIKLPPDIETKLREAVDAGEYTNITDAITGMLRLFFNNNETAKLQEKVDLLENDMDILKIRLDYLEKKFSNSNLKN